jgi:hypothetical protein
MPSKSRSEPRTAPQASRRPGFAHSAAVWERRQAPAPAGEEGERLVIPEAEPLPPPKPAARSSRRRRRG